MSDGVTGLGGVFFRARDPEALQAWHRDTLGVPAEEPMRSDGLVFGIFRADTDCFGPSGQGFMVNFRVASLEAVLERLLAAAVPEGNRFELWEPAEGM